MYIVIGIFIILLIIWIYLLSGTKDPKRIGKVEDEVLREEMKRQGGVGPGNF